MLYEPVYVNYAEQVNPWRESRPAATGLAEGSREHCRVGVAFPLGDEHVWDQTMEIC